MNTARKKDGFKSAVMGVFKESRPFSVGFRMLPMVDVLFLLLIFFILTTRFHQSESFLPFKLPSASAAPSIGAVEPLAISFYSVPSGCNVNIGMAKSVEVNRESMDENLAAFAAEFAAVLNEQKRKASDPVELVCDGGTQWQYIAKVYNILFGLGIRDITFRVGEQVEK